MTKIPHRRSDRHTIEPSSASVANAPTCCNDKFEIKSLIIIVTPVVPKRRGRFDDRYDARLNGRLIACSRTPFFEAARWLLADGYDTSTVVVMRHAGSNTDCLISTVGAAARLTVDEHNGTRSALWKPLPGSAGAARVASRRREAPRDGAVDNHKAAPVR